MHKFTLKIDRKPKSVACQMENEENSMCICWYAMNANVWYTILNHTYQRLTMDGLNSEYE